MAGGAPAILVLSLLTLFAEARIPGVYTAGAWQTAHATFYSGGDTSGTMVSPLMKDIPVSRMMIGIIIPPPPEDEDCLGNPCNDKGICDYDDCACSIEFVTEENPHCVYSEGLD